MATSLTFSNFLSSLFPTKTPPLPKLPTTNLPLSSPIPNLHLQKTKTLLTSPPPPAAGQFSHSSPLSADLTSVICPSLANANTLFFKSAYNVQVIVDENEHEERLLNRFRREVMRAGIIQECKRRRFFENKQEEKKRRIRDAAKRNRRSRRPFRPPIQTKTEESSSRKKDDDDEDNWELPEANLSK